MEPDGKGRVRLEYRIPARGLIGFQTEFRTITAGTGLLFHVFDHYGPKAEGAIAKRQNGVLISNDSGPLAGLRAGRAAGARPPVRLPKAGRNLRRPAGRHPRQGQRPHRQRPAHASSSPTSAPRARTTPCS
jgi:hypothetical protein